MKTFSFSVEILFESRDTKISMISQSQLILYKFINAAYLPNKSRLLPELRLPTN